MDIGIVSARYAKALLRFAIDNGEVDKVYQEILCLVGAFRKIGALQDAMKNPILSDDRKLELLRKASTPAGQKVTVSSDKFFALLLLHKRADLTLYIANAFIGRYQQYMNLVHGHLTVATDKIAEQIGGKMQQLVEQRTNAKVNFDIEVDPSIGGGFVLEYDTYRMDASLRGQIDALRRALI